MDLGKDISKAKQVLEGLGLVAIPTETVYGLAANGLREPAVSKIFKAKNRPNYDPLILHVGSIKQAEDIAEFNDSARLLAKRFWPGPLTLVLKKDKSVPEIVTSGLDTVGIRIPNHPLTQALLESLDFPLAAPSANPFGYVSPTTAQHVADQLGENVDYILDGGPCQVGLESTIVDLSTSEPEILRQGGIPNEAIFNLIGEIPVRKRSSSNPKAPGMLEHHYAPQVKLIVGDIPALITQNPDKRIAVIGFESTYGKEGIALSPAGNIEEAARNLFAALRTLDRGNYDLILSEWVPDVGIGMAINDKLRRASNRN